MLMDIEEHSWMAKTLDPKLHLCADCQSRFDSLKGAITAGDISEKEALRDAVRDCDTDDYFCFYPFGFSKHGVIFVAEEEAERSRVLRRQSK